MTNLFWLGAFFFGVCFGAPALVAVFERVQTRRALRSVPAGVEEAQAYANRPTDEEKAVVAASRERCLCLRNTSESTRITDPECPRHREASHA